VPESLSRPAQFGMFGALFSFSSNDFYPPWRVD
jgi:hypothetical protein